MGLVFKLFHHHFSNYAIWNNHALNNLAKHILRFKQLAEVTFQNDGREEVKRGNSHVLEFEGSPIGADHTQKFPNRTRERLEVNQEELCMTFHTTTRE